MLKKYYYFKQYNNKDILNLYSNIGVFCLYNNNKNWNKQTKGLSIVFDILIYNQYNCIHMEKRKEYVSNVKVYIFNIVE